VRHPGVSFFVVIPGPPALFAGGSPLRGVRDDEQKFHVVLQ